MTNKDHALKHPFPYYLLAIAGSLSSAGASMTLLALSTSFYTIDQEGIASSSIYLLYYLGIGAVGFLGGWVLQRFTSLTLGITGALASALIVFYLGSLEQISPFVGLPIVFCIFILSGIDHPNTLRFFNEVIHEKKKIAFFSIKESATSVLGLIAPVFAAFIIKMWGVRVCFFIDGITYLVSCLPWLMIKKHYKINNDPVKSTPDWFVGYKLLIKDQNIRSLNLSRLLNNLAYVTWTTALPLLLAKIAKGDTSLFAQQQGISSSLVSGGFIVASLVASWFVRQTKLMATMVWGSSILGFSSVTLLALSLFQSELLYLSAIFLGLGTYCFRISGMTLGQAFTPEKMLGAVIVAGDTIVRGWSFIISLSIISIFRLHETCGFSTPALGVFVTILPCFSLFSPLLIGKLAKGFLKQNEEQSKT